MNLINIDRQTHRQIDTNIMERLSHTHTHTCYYVMYYWKMRLSHNETTLTNIHNMRMSVYSNEWCSCNMNKPLQMDQVANQVQTI